MKLREILLQLPPETLESLAREKLSQVTDIRLPHNALVDELAEILGSYAYVKGQVALRHPPCFAILNLLLSAPGNALPTEGLRQAVQDETERMIVLASRSPVFPKPKNYALYLKMLAAAWESDEEINPSEANMLRVLREELGISLMEHLIIEHHPDLHRFWRNEQAYENERNHLRRAGMLFSVEGRHTLAEDTVVLIRRAWGMELSSEQYGRLLDVLSNEDLRRILESEGLNVSGTAREKKERVFENYVSPRAAMEAVHIDGLREATRTLGCRPYGAKEEVIENLLDWLDTDEDLKAQAAAAAAAAAEAAQQPDQPPAPEPRLLSKDAFTDLLRRLTNESLYDAVAHLPGLRKSGSKDERAKRLLDSPYSEHTILEKVTNTELHSVCKELGLIPYGPKEEKIGRLIDAYRNFKPPAPAEASNIIGSSEKEAVDGVQPSVAPVESQLPQLPSVRADFPFLTGAEHVVLSYLLDFKSLSDLELEKLIQRFALPWILPKAEMDEMIKKLRSRGRDVIRVRALGDHNIYELAS